MSHWKLNTSQREIRAKAGQDFVLTTASTAQRGLERSSRLVGHTRATVLHSTTGASKSSSCKIQPLASSSISLHCPLRVSGAMWAWVFRLQVPVGTFQTGTAWKSPVVHPVSSPHPQGAPTATGTRLRRVTQQGKHDLLKDTEL